MTTDVTAMWWQALIGTLGGLLLLWLALLAFVWRTQRDLRQRSTLRQALHLVPDVVRLLRRLAADPTVPRGVRLRLLLLLAYLLSPIDIVPDVIPVLGHADDAVIAAIALRSAIRRAGPDALVRHWPGTPEGLAALTRLAGDSRRSRGQRPAEEVDLQQQQVLRHHLLRRHVRDPRQRQHAVRTSRGE